MEYRICWDRLGNRAVISCSNGYPIGGILLPDGYEGHLNDDIEALSRMEPPIGGMLLDTPICINIVESNRCIEVTDDGIGCNWELSDAEKRYLAAR